MGTIMNIQDIVNFLKLHRSKLTLGLLLILSITLLLNYRVININVEGDITGDLVITARPESEIPSDDLKVDLRNGLNIVGRRAITLDISDKDKESSVSISPKFFNMNNITVSLVPQKKVDTAFYDSRQSTCYFKANRSGYGCLNSKIFSQKTDPAIQNSLVLENLVLIGNQQNYKQGIISIAQTGEPGDLGTKPALTYITASEVKVIDQSLDKYGNLGEVEIVSSKNNDSFILHDIDGKKLYYYDSVNDSSPIEHLYANDINKTAYNIEVSHVGNTIFLSGLVNEDEDSEHDHPNYLSFVWRFIINNESITKSTEYSISDITKADNSSGDTHVIRENLLGSFDRLGTLRLIDVSNEKKPRIISRLFNISHYITDKGVIYYERLGKVYKFDTVTTVSNLIRNVPGSVRFMNIVDDSLILDIVSNNSRSTNSLFIVTTETKDGIEPFDVIPVNPRELPVISSRFKGNVIYIAVDLKSLYRPDGVKPVYDEDEYSKARNEISSKLRSSGLDLNKYNIRYSPGVVMVDNTILFSQDELVGE